MTMYVYSPASRTLKTVIDQISGLLWENLSAGAGEIELYVPLSCYSEIEEDDIIWLGGKRAGVVEGLSLFKDSTGEKSLKISGHTAEIYLDRRTIYPAIQKTGSVSTVVSFLLYKNLINPSDSNRQIQFIGLDLQQESLGQSINYQQTGGNLLTEVSALCQAHSLGFLMEFDPASVSFTFKIYQGLDRSKDQTDNPVVFVSSELDDILSSSYESSKALYKNFAYIGGEDSGAERIFTSVNLDGSEGYLRRELFVDARDLQNEVNGTSLNSSTYEGVLQDRGLKKLEQYKAVQEFSAEIAQNPSANKFGVDYDLGDTVTVCDSDLGVVVNAIVSSEVVSFSEGKFGRAIYFGYGIPTIHKIVRGLM